MTEKMQLLANASAPPGLHFTGITAPFGEPYISTPAAAAAAARAMEDVAKHLAADPVPAAAIIACFGDPGLFAMRRRLKIPVIGMADASCHVACQLGERFAIVTGGRAWGPMLNDFVAAIGLSSRLAAIETLDWTGDRVAADPEGAEAAVLSGIEACREAGADVVILGGAGLVGLAERLHEKTPLPLLDSLACAVTTAGAMVQIRAARR